MKTGVFSVSAAIVVCLLFAGVTGATNFTGFTVTDQTATAPLSNPTPAGFQPRYLSGFGLDNTFTVFFEDRDAANLISYAATTTGATGFPASATGTSVIPETHFCVKDWPINVGGTDYDYRAWGSVGNNLDHVFYVSNDLVNWTAVDTFTVSNAVPFTGARGYVYYGFHDVILLNGTYYAFGESNQGQTMLVRSVNGDNVWEAFASIGGTLAADGPLQMPESPTPSGSFVELGYDRGYGKLQVRGNDGGCYLAVNEAAKPSLAPAALEAAFINPANWTWDDGSTGLPTVSATPVLLQTAEHDVRECWVVPNTDPDADWVIMYDADFGAGDGGKALGYATLTPPPPPPVHNITQGTDHMTIQAGISAANPGDVIECDAGTYAERITISKSIDLRGAQYNVDPTAGGARTNPANESIIDITGLSVTNPNVAVEIPSGVTNVEFNGFTVLGSQIFHYADETVFRLWDDYVGIKYNIIDGYFAVLSKGGYHQATEYNRIVINKVGVTVQPNPGGDVSISYNTITPGTGPAADAAGIYMTGVTDADIIGNVANGFIGGNGVGGSNLTNITIEENTFDNNRKGINFWGTTTFITAGRNTITNCSNAGVNIKGQDITIENNVITGNDVGVEIEKHVLETERVVVFDNDLSGNTTLGLSVGATVIETVDASGNWWGSNVASSVQAEANAGLGADYTPWLDVGTDTEGGTPGFQGDFSVLHVDDDSPQVGSTGYIQEGVDLADGSTVNVKDGLYQGTIDVDGLSGLTVQGESQVGTVFKPASLLSWAIPGRPEYDYRETAIRVVGSTDIAFKNMTVDMDLVTGNNKFGFFYWNATGEISGNLIQNMSDAGGGYYEITSYFRAPDYTDGARAQIDILNNTFLKTGRLGVCTHEFVNALIEGNTFDMVDDDFGYAMEIGSASTGTVRNNTIRNYDTWAATDHSSSAAIYVENSFTGGLGPYDKPVVIENNEMYNCQYGIYAGNEFAGYAGDIDIQLTITGNSIHDNSAAAPEGSGGIILTDEGKDAGSSLTADLSGNTIVNNGDVGVFCFTRGNGDLDISMEYNVVTGHDEGVHVEEYDGAAMSSFSIDGHWNGIYGNTSYGVNNQTAVTVDFLSNWWGDATGPYQATTNPAGLGNDVTDYVLYDPWIGKSGSENIICDPDPEYLNVAAPTKTISVDYLGGGGGLMYGYSVKFSWDGSVASTDPSKVIQGSLLSDAGPTHFFVNLSGANEISVDCALGGAVAGVTGPGTMFTIEFTGVAVGTSPIDITVIKIRDQNNTPLSGFFEDDGELIVDVSSPDVSNVFIENLTLAHTDDYIKDTDAARVTATVTDDDPAFDAGNIVADLSGLGGGAAVNPDTYDGTTATWTTAITSVACTPANGTVTVTVTATDDLANTDSDTDDIIADNIPPAAITNLAAVQLKSGNDGDGTTKITLTFTAPGDAYETEVYGAGYGDYPEYDDGTGSEPAAPAYPPGAPWAVTAVTASGQMDEPAVRDFWYYVVFTKDIAYNISAVSNKTDGTLNYHLGDVSDGATPGQGDNYVNSVDFSLLGTSYWKSDGDGGYLNYCDVGPTVDLSTDELPTTDNKIDFEDLMMFAINFTTVTFTGGDEPEAMPVLERPAMKLEWDKQGSEQSDVLVARLVLEGNTRSVKGLHAEIPYDSDGLELVAVVGGELLTEQSAPVFAEHLDRSGLVQFDAAAMGTGVVIHGSGTVATLRFQLAGAVERMPRLASGSLRDRRNRTIRWDVEPGVVDETVPASTAPGVLSLGANPNPFSGSTQIQLNLPSTSRVSLRVYDVSGRLVTTLADDVMTAGSHNVEWNCRSVSGERVAAGVYVAILKFENRKVTRKLFVLP